MQYDDDDNGVTDDDGDSGCGDDRLIPTYPVPVAIFVYTIFLVLTTTATATSNTTTVISIYSCLKVILL